MIQTRTDAALGNYFAVTNGAAIGGGTARCAYLHKLENLGTRFLGALLSAISWIIPCYSFTNLKVTLIDGSKAHFLVKTENLQRYVKEIAHESPSSITDHWFVLSGRSITVR